ncbi:MAG: hypothetical protein E7639_02355 [Ruminococcaceae bacterium]|nr:hypothetical protein [Oscillospiraceae bacterium]
MADTSFTDFSLLFPSKAAKAKAGAVGTGAHIDDFTLEELGLAEILPLKNASLSEFITTDPEVIRYREAIFADLLAHSEITATFGKLMPVLCDIMELRRLDSDSGDTADYLTGITEIELYITSIDVLYQGLCREKRSYRSEALNALTNHIAELVESEYYTDLNRRLEELTSRVREIKSVTLGVNLDAQLRPRDAGVLAINAEPFHSGDTLQKILRLNLKNDAYTCIAELVPFGKKQNENQKTALSLAFTSAINDVYRHSLRSWKRIVQMYVLENTDFLLNLLPEFEFLVKGTNLVRALGIKGCTLSIPEIKDPAARAFTATGFYNPTVALKTDDAMVKNDIDFDEKAGIYVLTGPNRGGKSVVTCAVGMIQAMAQLGLPVPAEKATLSPVDAIFTHFPTGADDTIDKGRLGEECARLGEIFDSITDKSLVLLDETLSSTGSFEASYIAAEVLAGLSMARCRAIFSTHLHELSGEIDAINARTAPLGGVPIDTLVAGIEGEGRRSFRILRTKPDGKSYARDIAVKYGLTYDNILSKLNHNKTEG